MRFWSAVLIGFVHQAGRLGFGAADLCFGGLFPVVVTNKIARSCTATPTIRATITSIAVIVFTLLCSDFSFRFKQAGDAVRQAVATIYKGAFHAKSDNKNHTRRQTLHGHCGFFLSGSGLYKTGALRLWRNSGHGDDLHTVSFIPYY